MNKHQVEGRVDESKGKVKEVAGRVVGNERLESEGLLDQAKGKAQATYGDAKESAKDKAKDAIDRI
ncbi:MAG: CsbD family protein [Polaromonas sp.]|nr:CsbD family protein [Polaromonas sp.]